MFDPLSLGLLVMSRYLSSRTQRSTPTAQSSARCVICQRGTEMVTTCCKTPLCPYHLQAWKADPAPCPCRR